MKKENHDGRIYFTLKAEDKDAFYELCDRKCIMPSKVFRKFVSAYIKCNGEFEWD